MGVGVQGEACREVSQHPGHRLDVHTVLEGQGGEGVPEIVEPEVLQAMEHEALQSPRFLPVRVNREGDLSGALASADQLGRLGQYVEKLLHQIAREVRDGNIDADPCCRSEDDSFCKYCDWADACHFQDGRDGDHLHYILPVKPEDFWRQVEEETERGGGN